MCVACAISKNASITEEEFERCWESNPDGGGYAFIDENENIIMKHSMRLDEFKKMWKTDHAKHGDYSPFLLHFRIGTHGEKSLFNCHPFRVNKDVVMIHNGIIPGMGAYKADEVRSDTRIFVEDYLAMLPVNFLRNKVMRFFINDYIGTGNKLVFLDKIGGFTIFNQKAGTIDNNRWFSNDSWKTPRRRPTPPPTPPAQTNSARNGSTYPNTTTSWQTGKKPCAWCRDVVVPQWENGYLPLCDLCKKYVVRIQGRTKLSEYETKEMLNKSWMKHATTQLPLLVAGRGSEDSMGVVPGATKHEAPLFNPSLLENLSDEEAAIWEAYWINGGYPPIAG